MMRLLEIRSFKSQRHIYVSIESDCFMTVSWIGEQVIFVSQVGKHISLVNYLSWVKEHLSLRICVSGLGLEVNFSVHLQIFASKIFSTSKLVRQILSLCFGDMDDSNLQMFPSGHFFHLQIIKITRILWALISSPG